MSDSPDAVNAMERGGSCRPADGKEGLPQEAYRCNPAAAGEQEAEQAAVTSLPGANLPEY